MSENFGARLRQRREAQNVELVTIAEQTKIKLSLLDALERDDVSHWPSGIFRRAYIRAYAVAIGLSPDETLREFQERFPDPAEVEIVTSAKLAAADRSESNGGARGTLGHLFSSALGSLSRRRQMSALSTEPTRLDTEVPAADLPRETSEVHAAHLNTISGGTGNMTIPGAVPTIGSTPRRDPAPSAAPVMAKEPAADEPEVPDPDIAAFAQLCTDLSRIETAGQIPALLGEAARILDASGVIVWVWDGAGEVLRPALAHGYSRRVLAQVPPVSRGEKNVTAAAFRGCEISAVEAEADSPGALAVPLQNPGGCAGVLALELRHGGERRGFTRALATILASFLAQIIQVEEPVETVPEDRRLRLVGG